MNNYNMNNYKFNKYSHKLTECPFNNMNKMYNYIKKKNEYKMKGGINCNSIYEPTNLSEFIIKKYIPETNVKTKIQKSSLDIQNNNINVIFKENNIYEIKNAEILIADYDRLRHDFIYFKDKTEIEINDYILKHCAIMTSSNVEKKDILYKNELNLQLKKNIDNYSYFRPPNYGRALVFIDNLNNVQFDMKGVGVGKYFKKNDDNEFYQSVDYLPSHTSHKNGCFPLGEAIQEYFNEHNFRNIIRHSDIMRMYNIDTLKSYAIIKLNIKLSDGFNTEIGIYVRQVVNREIDLFNLKNKLFFSTIFSMYGIGSHANGGNYINMIEYINVQGSNNIIFSSEYKPIIYLIDFSGYYYYCDNNILKQIITQNVIKYVSTYIIDLFFLYINEKSNLKMYLKQHNNDEIELLANKLDDTLIHEKNKFEIYKIIRQYYLKKINTHYVNNTNNNIIEIIQLIISLLMNIIEQYWFKCNLTESKSMYEFCEMGEYDVRIRQKLLKQFGNPKEASNLNNLICNIADEFNIISQKCVMPTETQVFSFIISIQEFDKKIIELIQYYSQQIFTEFQPEINQIFNIHLT
jgi:hypothetical protein